MKIPRLLAQLGVASVLTALAIAGCGNTETADPVGSVDINIDLGGTDGGLTINQVSWEITSDPEGDPVDDGVINVSQPGSTASFEKFGLFPGAYIVTLTATAVDGNTQCSGSAPFSIAADVRTDVSVLLNCETAERLGAVRVNGEFNRCADLTMVSISPLEVAVGFDIDLMATADDDEGDPINFQWSATGGTIDDPLAGSGSDPAESLTFYTCAASGTQTITVQVSDDLFTYCVDTWEVQVECVPAPLCGNGVVDPGESCDPPNGVTCDADCQRIPTCGDGFVDPGEDCDPPDGVFCDAACQFIDPCDPNPCDDQNSCTVNICDADPVDNTAVCNYPSEADGTACDDFAPDSAVCIGGVCQPVPPGVTQTVNVLCSNNVTADISDLPYELSVTPLGPVVDGVPVDFAVDGVAQFPPSFLNAALATIPGLTEVTLTGLTSTTAVRSGASGPDVALSSDLGLPTQVSIPIVNDAPTCTGAGLPTPCVLEPLLLPLAAQTVTLTPTGGPGGEILFGWDESRFPPIPIVLGSPGPVSTRVTAVVLQVGLECGMGICRDAGACDDPLQIDSLTDAELISIPISP